MTATEQLTAALADLADRGGRPPCHGDDRWTSDDRDDRDDRAQAAGLCRGCPVIEACAAAATAAPREKWHVWAGRDRTPIPRK